jgi:putative ABC transport system permease protein
MFRNLLKVSLRNIVKEKGYSLINILGLTLGITSSVFLFMYVFDELSYDRYHEHADDIYRVVSNIKEPDNSFTWAVAQMPLADELGANYPEVKSAVRFVGLGRLLYTIGDKTFQEEEFYLADSLIFEMFDYQFVAGDPASALKNPQSIVLTESVAVKYFGTTDCLGKTLTDQDNDQVNVTGVIEDVPINSHFRFDALMSRNTLPQYQGGWGNFSVFTYLQFPKGYDATLFQPNLDSIISQHVNPIFESMGISIKYEMQPIVDIHLHSKIQDEVEEGGDMSYIYIFSAIAFFMLIIASINYMNLATARSTKRAKEVGVRKVMGAFRSHLIAQFITESVLLSLISLILSLGLLLMLLPAFNNLANKQIGFEVFLQPNIIGLIGGVVLFIGLVGGSYPAFYLSGFNPVTVLKGKLSNKGGNSILRKVLVVLQFSISIFMLIATLIAYDQLNFLMNKDLGFSKEQVVRITVPDRTMRRSLGALRNKLLQTPTFTNVATSTSTPVEIVNRVIFNVESNDGQMLEKGIDFYETDFDYISTMQMDIVEGRGFTREVPGDTLNAVLVNEAMVARLGWVEPIGKRFEIPQRDTVITKRVIGVIKDYHQNSLYDVIEPLMVIFRRNNRFTFIKISEQNITQTMASIESIWSEVYPNSPFEYSFLDQDFATQYDADRRRGEIFTIFSLLTIFIACLGLLGLTSFTTAQRSKEIGIRKVIGASVQHIVVLVSKEFIWMVMIATLIACPIAWYFMENWLEAFAYKIELSGEIFTFAISALLALIITMITVGFHTAKAATMNPVDTLHNE